MNFQASNPDFRFPQLLAKSQKLTALEKVILIFLFNNYKGDLTIEALAKFLMEPKERIVESIKHLIEINVLVDTGKEIQVPEKWVTAVGWLPVIKKAPKEKAIKQFTPPTLKEWSDYFASNGYKNDVAINSWKAYDAAGWKDSTGKQVLNWKQKATNVWFKEEHLMVKVNKPKPGTGGINI